MELPKILVLLCCIYCSYASEKSHIIPIEGYETELQNLGQHVEIPETPVKVIKITKTIAVKIPVPYPVKVREKVPYPVHVAKPYPVPVPQIIKVPVSPHGHKDSSKEGHHSQDPSYEVQENSYGGDHYESGPNSHNSESFGEEYPAEFSSGGSSHAAPSHNFYGGGHSASDVDSSVEGKSYDQAIQEYLQKHNQNGLHSGGGNHYY